MYTRLTSNSQGFACLHLLNVRVKCMFHRAQTLLLSSGHSPYCSVMQSCGFFRSDLGSAELTMCLPISSLHQFGSLVFAVGTSLLGMERESSSTGQGEGKAVWRSEEVSPNNVRTV